jgi:hypothetical protein
VRADSPLLANRQTVPNRQVLAVPIRQVWNCQFDTGLSRFGRLGTTESPDLAADSGGNTAELGLLRLPIREALPAYSSIPNDRFASLHLPIWQLQAANLPASSCQFASFKLPICQL